MNTTPNLPSRPGRFGLQAAAGRRRTALWIMRVGACLALAACGGGGGGGSQGPGSAPLGLVKVIVQDSFGAPVPGVTVQGPLSMSKTDAQGTAMVTLSSPDATANVALSRDSFEARTVSATSVTGRVNELPVTLERSTKAAGGSLNSRSGSAPVVDGTGQQLSFEVELVVVDGKSKPIMGLSSADFMLRPCAPVATNDRNDCVNGPGVNVDVAYTPATERPESLLLVPGAPATPYAVALLLDQSGSIADTDPTGARLYSAKTFLKRLGADDQALLAAFSGAPGALIPTVPLTVYAPFKDQAAAASYFPTLDALAPLLGGNTPLYDSLDSLRQQMAGTLTPPAGRAKAIVVFTDGADTTCGNADACRISRERAIQGAGQDGVRLLTIGLSGSVDTAALGELANQTGGAFLYAASIEQLLPLYGSVGDLVNLSMPTYRLRWTVSAATVGSFRSGNSLLGRVQVTASGSTFELPFIVGIP